MDSSGSTAHDERLLFADTLRRSTRMKFALAAAGLIVAGVLVALYLTNRVSDPSESVAQSSWSATAIRCSGLPDAPEIDLWDTQRGEVIELTGQVDSFVTLHNCHTIDDPTDANRDDTLAHEGITEDPDVGYFIVVMASDRHDVRLVQIDLEALSTHLTVEHHVSGPQCVETADWRGHLLLLVEAPSEAPVPTVTLHEHHLGC